MYRSHDGGSNWEALPGMPGKSVRALAMSASDSSVLVVGALDGVYHQEWRQQWERVSPMSRRNKENIESIAVDPESDVVYAGTWHSLEDRERRG